MEFCTIHSTTITAPNVNLWHCIINGSIGAYFSREIRQEPLLRYFLLQISMSARVYGILFHLATTEPI